MDCGGKDDAVELNTALKGLGVRLSEIELLVLTHLHYDHCENAGLFPNAAIVAHWKELECIERMLYISSDQELRAYLRSQYDSIHDYYLRRICQRLAGNREEYRRLCADRGRLMVMDGDSMDIDQFSIVGTRGHSEGHVAVSLQRKRHIWIAGDAVASQDGLADRHRAAGRICWNSIEQQRAATRIANGSGIIIPGHGHPFDAVTGEKIDYDTLE